jgi:DNA-directed RNA polymerase subunit RPC12/RpoP
MKRTAYIDEMAMASEFSTGDVVRKTGSRDLVLSPYVGRVVSSNAKTGRVMVQWPWGVDQESPVELVKDLSGDYAPPMAVNQYYSSYDINQNIATEDKTKADTKWRKSLASVIVDKYENATLPVWRAACKTWHHGIDRVEAFKRISSIFADKFGSDAVRITVSNLYNLGERLAIYYKANKRRYKVTNKEHTTGKYNCPTCRTEDGGKIVLKPRAYTHKGRNLQCPQCGFTITPNDLILPGQSYDRSEPEPTV